MMNQQKQKSDDGPSHNETKYWKSLIITITKAVRQKKEFQLILF